MDEDRKIQEMYEAKDVPADSELLRMASKSIRFAIEDMDTSMELVNEAAEELADTPDGDRIASILGEMEGLLKDLKDMQSKWEVA